MLGRPPIPGAPWSRLGPRLNRGGRAFVPAGTSAGTSGAGVAATGGGASLAAAGKVKPFVPRVETDNPALRRHTQVTADILNSLMRQGYLYQTAAGVWVLAGAGASGSGVSGVSGSFP